MKKIVIMTWLFVWVLSCGSCNKAADQKNDAVILSVTPVPKQEEPQVPLTQEDIAIKKKEMVDAINELESVACPSLELYADKEVSLLNSNVLCNSGYLAFDEHWNVYFADENIGGIFVSDRYGKNRRQITPDSGKNLQLVDGWLYYVSTADYCIKRIHVETGTQEIVSESVCTAFLVYGDRLYINTDEGLFVTNQEGKDSVALGEPMLRMEALQITGDGSWLGNASLREDAMFFYEGNLLFCREDKNRWMVAEEKLCKPLLAGHMLSFTEPVSLHLVSWNLETGSGVEFTYGDFDAVSDGEFLYSCIASGGMHIFYRFDGKENKELFRMKSDLYVYHKFLTPDMLYWMNTDAKEDWMWELWYYEMETGKIGQIY